VTLQEAYEAWRRDPSAHAGIRRAGWKGPSWVEPCLFAPGQDAVRHPIHLDCFPYHPCLEDLFATDWHLVDVREGLVTPSGGP
jgi:hypothetical protein